MGPDPAACGHRCSDRLRRKPVPAVARLDVGADGLGIDGQKSVRRSRKVSRLADNGA